ncbi:MAG: AAA family ATPase [Bryobacteraceae bacterium]|jgi:predicted ATPase
MITHVRARNFKSLRNVDLSLGPLNVLVGPNMGGKSNILDLFRFLYECWSPTFGLLGALAGRQGIDEVLWKGNQDRVLSMSVHFLEPPALDKEFVYELEIVGGAGGYASIQKETLALWTGDTTHQLIVNEGRGRWLQNADSEKLVMVPADRSGLELAPPNWIGYPFKSLVQNWLFHQLVPSLMRQSNQMTGANVLDSQGSNLSARLMLLQTRYPEAFARIEDVARHVFPEIRQLLTWPTQHGTVYLASQERGLIRPTPLFQMSDGELAFIAYLSLIFAPDELRGTLMLIEEPENHLHPKLFETLVALLRQVQQEAVACGVPPLQVVFTTHSPHVIDQMKIEEILWVEKRQGETKLIRPNDKPHLRKLVEDEELGLGDLMFAGALGEE